MRVGGRSCTRRRVWAVNGSEKVGAEFGSLPKAQFNPRPRFATARRPWKPPSSPSRARFRKPALNGGALHSPAALGNSTIPEPRPLPKVQFKPRPRVETAQRHWKTRKSASKWRPRVASLSPSWTGTPQSARRPRYTHHRSYPANESPGRGGTTSSAAWRIS